MDADGPAEVDDLYAVVPSDFVAARDALARRLREAGRKEDAADVRRRRRPSVVAWALNQLRRRSPDDLDSLVALGERLRDAQRQMMTGGGRDALRAATAERRALVDRLASAAGGWLVDEDVSSSPHRDEIAAVLDAATVDGDVAGLLREAELSTEPKVTGGLGELLGGAPPDEADPRLAEAERRARVHREEAAEATMALDEARRAVREMEESLAGARRRLADAERDEERLERLAADARRRSEESDEALRDLRGG